MERNYLSLGRRAIRHWLRLLLLFAFLLIAVFSPFAWLVQAEGSVNLIANGGDRPHLEDRDGTLGGLSRSNVIKVFVNPGETINLGSSALGIGGATINYSPPGALPGGNCGTTQPVGYIPDLAAELAGPFHSVTNNGPNTFVPCVVTVGPGEGGIWEIEFESPNPANGLNPPQRSTTTNWPTQGNNNNYITAWDVTVRDSAGASLPGRVFANYLTLNMGTISGTLRSETFLQTIDGYRYRIDMNGLNPFVFTYFANNKGFTNLSGNGIYRSLQFTYTTGENFGAIPPGYTIHRPTDPDNLATNDITHKIFFNQPAGDLPTAATVPGGGTTWLLVGPTPPPPPTEFSFVGVEGTSGQAGTAPLSGTFSFSSSIAGSFSIAIDVDKNGVFTDPIDRTLFGTTQIGANSVLWDGLDSNGNPLPPGPVPYGSQLTLSGGETHFPFFDPERNPSGYIIERLIDPDTASPEPDPFQIFYNDQYNYTGNNTYDFSLCAEGESPPPPFNLGCYGEPPTPRNGLNGVLSSNGAHEWSTVPVPQITDAFGNLRGIDTWALYPSQPVLLSGGILLAEADLQIHKSHTPEPVAPGGLINYTILVTNAGPSPAPGINVSDTFPGVLSGISWSCNVISGTGSCPASGTGDISATLNLSQTAVARFQVVATIASNATGPITNTVQVDRPNDVTDPILANNVFTDVATLVPAADLAIGKDSQPKPLVPNQPITYTIVVTNLGPSPVSDITVTDNLPPEVLAPTYSANPPTYNQGTGVWTGVNLDQGETVTLTIVGTVSPSTQLLINTAVVTSPVRDPITTNNIITHTNVSTPEADLAIQKDSQPKPLIPGQGITYTLVVTNFGPSSVNNITVTDNLPPGVLVQSYLPSSGSYNPVTGAWTGLTLDMSDQITLTIRGTVDPAVTSLTNVAVITSPIRDPITPNNRFTDTNTFAAPILHLLKTVLPAGAVEPGQTLTYTLCYSNSGGITATNTVLTDIIPANTSYVNGSASTTPPVEFNNGSSWSPTEPATGTVGIRWLVNSLPPDSLTRCVSFHVRVNTELDLGSLQLKYTPEGWLVAPPPAPKEDQPPVSVTPVLTVTPLVKPAPTLTATPVVTFTPTATIEARTPLLYRGPGLALLPWWQEAVTSTVEGPTETPEPTSEATEAAETTPEATEAVETTPETTEVTETVTATEEIPPATETPVTETPSVTETTAPVTETPAATETVPTPAITTTPVLTGTPEPATPTVTETVTPPPVVTETVTATTVPSATEAVVSPTVTATLTVTPEATVTASPTLTLTVTPTLTPTLPPTPQSWRLVPLETYTITIRNNAALGSDNSPPVTSSVTKPLIALVDPGITKVANVEEAEPGDEVIFTIEVFNDGNLRATNVRVVDPVPDFLDILQVTTDDPTIPPALIVGQVFTVNVGILDPGERVVITLRTQVNDSAANEPNPIRNTATLSFDEGNPLQAADQVTVPSEPTPTPTSPPDDSDDDDDGGDDTSPTPTPAPPPAAPPAVAMVPTVPPQPTLPALYLPETGLRESRVETGNRGGLLLLLIVGTGLMLLFYRYRRKL